MQSLESLSASVADDLECHITAHDPAGVSASSIEWDRRAASALLRWVATRGLDGGALLCGWELGVDGQRGTDGVGGLLDRVAAAERGAWSAIAARASEATLQASDALALHPRLRAAARMLTRTALKGFIVGREQAHRRWIRDLRHDLRNPIGAIKNALALLEETGRDDGSVQRLCGIASRNASQLEVLVRSRAADEADRGAVEWAGRGLASVVVGRVVDELGAEAPEAAPRLAGARIPEATVDALALEIALHAAVRHVLESGRPASISAGVNAGTSHAERVTLRLAAPLADDRPRSASGGSGRRTPPLLAVARAVATGVGGQFTTSADGALLLSLPVLAPRDEGQDLPGRSQRDDRQPGLL